MAEPGQHHDGELERGAKRQSVAADVVPRHRLLQRGQRSGQVTGPDPDDASPLQGHAQNGIVGAGAG